jgi:hypothetical protein
MLSLHSTELGFPRIRHFLNDLCVISSNDDCWLLLVVVVTCLVETGGSCAMANLLQCFSLALGDDGCFFCCNDENCSDRQVSINATFVNKFLFLFFVVNTHRQHAISSSKPNAIVLQLPSRGRHLSRFEIPKNLPIFCRYDRYATHVHSRPARGCIT